jgi:hypothetical protein
MPFAQVTGGRVYAQVNVLSLKAHPQDSPASGLPIWHPFSPGSPYLPSGSMFSTLVRIYVIYPIVPILRQSRRLEFQLFGTVLSLCPRSEPRTYRKRFSAVTATIE